MIKETVSTAAGRLERSRMHCQISNLAAAYLDTRSVHVVSLTMTSVRIMG